MKRYFAIITVTLLSALCLCACSRPAKVDQDKLDELKKKAEQQSTKEDRAEEAKEEPKEEEKKEEVPEGFFAKAFYDGKVENNGGAFVRVGDRVYFRVYGTRALELTTIGGPSIDEVNADVPSTICYYDLDKDETVEVCELCAIGPLYATVDGLCIMSYPDGTPSTTLVDENGKTDEHYLNGQIRHVSDDGRSIEAGESDENEMIVPVVYRDGKRIGEAKEDGAEMWCSPVGFSNNDLIVTMAAPNALGETLYSYDENGRLTRLGDLEPMDMQAYELSPIIEDMTATDDGGFVTVTYRDGTANAIAGWAVYEFTCGVKNSIEEYDSGGDTERFDFSYPKVTWDKKGRPKLAAHKSGEVYLSEGYYGDLMCITPEGEEVTIRTRYIDDPGEDAEYVSAIEGGVCFEGDTVFLLDLTGERCPEEDVGWRWAYNLGGIYYTYFRFDEDHIQEGGWPTAGTVAGIGSVGWNKGDIEYDRLVGEWEAYSINVEGERRLAKEEDSKKRAMISFGDVGGAMTYYKEYETGKVSQMKPLYHGDPDEDMEGTDYAYVYYSDEENPLKAGICYLSHNKLKIFYLYHFDGNATGWYEITYSRVVDKE